MQLDHVKLLRSAYYYTFQYAVTRIAQRFPVPDNSILWFWDWSSVIKLESRDCDWMNLIAILLGHYSRNRFLFRDYSLSERRSVLIQFLGNLTQFLILWLSTPESLLWLRVWYLFSYLTPFPIPGQCWFQDSKKSCYKIVSAFRFWDVRTGNLCCRLESRRCVHSKKRPSFTVRIHITGIPTANS